MDASAMARPRLSRAAMMPMTSGALPPPASHPKAFMNPAAVPRASGRTTAQGKSIPGIDLCHARAEVFWKARTRYPEAGIAYRQCANLGGPRAPEDLFLAARAFSRADRDADALPAFQSVIQHHPKTPWADQAEFHLARTHALAGRWMDESKHHRVKRQARRSRQKRALDLAAVRSIAADRVAKASEVDANLMRAPGLEANA